jgi:hypothetical protein
MTINICMHFYTCATLVDITATGVIRHTADKELERNQQRNWETVLQCIGLKAQPQLIDGPYRKELEIDEGTVFGDIFFNTKQLVWIFYLQQRPSWALGSRFCSSTNYLWIRRNC